MTVIFLNLKFNVIARERNFRAICFYNKKAIKIIDTRSNVKTGISVWEYQEHCPSLYQSKLVQFEILKDKTS